MCQLAKWIEIYSKEHEKNMKKFLERFKKMKNYDKEDYSDEACLYRAALKYHKRAAIETVKRRMLERNPKYDYIDMIMEIESLNELKWSKVDCGVKAKAVKRIETRIERKIVKEDEANSDEVIEADTRKQK